MSLKLHTFFCRNYNFSKLRTFKNTYFQNYVLSESRTFQNYVLLKNTYFSELRTFHNYVLSKSRTLKTRTFCRIPCFFRTSVFLKIPRSKFISNSPEKFRVLQNYFHIVSFLSFLIISRDFLLYLLSFYH